MGCSPLALPGAETEVQNIKRVLPESEVLIHEKATLNAFKSNSPRFPLIDLATHGCFQHGGCQKLGLEENTLVFSDQKLNIANAAVLGLENVDLITLSACQTALQTDKSGNPMMTNTTQPITGVAARSARSRLYTFEISTV